MPVKRHRHVGLQLLPVQRGEDAHLFVFSVGVWEVGGESSVVCVGWECNGEGK